MRYRIGVDIGGTFTDCAVIDENGARTVAKALTTPDALEHGVLDALELNARERACSRADLLRAADLFVHGTTQATNALLTRTGARTGLITTRGHEDVIMIGRVYAKTAGLAERELVHSSRLAKPEPIVPRELIRGVTERIDRDGDVLVRLDEDDVVEAIDGLLAEGVSAIAVCLLWSFVNDTHEQRIGELLAERASHVYVALSHVVAPRMGEYERTVTTAVNAYVGPRVAGYLERLESVLQQEGLGRPMLVMQASGGLTSTQDAARRPVVTLDSGPTGGILGCQHLARLDGEGNVICTDVGGTSFDVGLVLDGEVPLDPEPVVGQYSLRFPKVLVRSIGSGGGSIAWLDESGLLRVGPQSAGSRPGAACYGFGGTDATVTDADLVLGYLGTGSFLGGRMKLDRELALRALARLGGELGMEPEEVAVGIFRIINSQMADLIRSATIERGHDPRQCTMVAYGGAGPTHAVFYGGEIGARAILVPAESTVFSAVGILTCDMEHTEELSRRVVSPYDAHDLEALSRRFELLEQRVVEQFDREEVPAQEISLSRFLGVRFRQQVHTLEVGVDPGVLTPASAERVYERFIARYGEVYGSGALLQSNDTELELHRVVGSRPLDLVGFRVHERAAAGSQAALIGERQAYFEHGGFIPVRVYDGAVLGNGHVVEGPALIERAGGTVVLPPGFEATVDPYLTLRIARLEAPMPPGQGAPRASALESRR